MIELLSVLALCIIIFKWPNIFMAFVMLSALFTLEVVLHSALIACGYFLSKAYNEGIIPWLLYAAIAACLEVRFYRLLKKGNTHDVL